MSQPIITNSLVKEAINPEGDCFALHIGDHLYHHKRGSEYEVMGFINLNLYDKHDTQEVYMYSRREDHNHHWGIWLKRPTMPAHFVFPVMLQFDLKNASPYDTVLMVLYRSLYPKGQEPWMFLRPSFEFTPVRFSVLNRDPLLVHPDE